MMLVIHYQQSISGYEVRIDTGLNGCGRVEGDRRLVIYGGIIAVGATRGTAVASRKGDERQKIGSEPKDNWRDR